MPCGCRSNHSAGVFPQKAGVEPGRNATFAIFRRAPVAYGVRVPDLGRGQAEARPYAALHNR